jgi:enediyne polyketide synthase
VKAQEISQQGDDFVYDVNLYDIEGNQMELWEGLRLRRMADLQPTAPWPEVLVGPYMERMMERHLLHAPEIGVILTSDRAEQSVDKTANALKRLLGKSVVVRRRPDGKPETDNGLTISSAHCGPLTFAVAGHETLSCDAEAVIERGVSVWRDMLGDSCFSLAEHISHETGETRDLAYTRVWTALEGLRKVGRRQPTSIVSYSAPTPGWVILSEGNLRIATYACRVSHLQETLVFAIIHGI